MHVPGVDGDGHETMMGADEDGIDVQGPPAPWRPLRPAQRRRRRRKAHIRSARSPRRIAEMMMATDKSRAALTWLSMVLVETRPKRDPISADADQRHAAHPVRQAAPTTPMPCGRLEANIAGASSSPEIWQAAATRRRRPRPRAGRRVRAGRQWCPITAGAAAGAIRQRQHRGAAVRMITRMVCTTAIAGTSAPFSAARIVICDSAPGLPARNAEVRSQPWTRCR